MKAPGEKPFRNGLASARHDTLVTELAKAELDLERIEAQRTAANARIAALRNELAAHDATPRSSAPEPLSELAPRTPADKVKLFRQLFRGRPDLYPTRFVSKKTGKAGYAPACSNKFVPGVCELPKVKCGDCTRQAFKPVDNAAVMAHLKGQHVMGVYRAIGYARGEAPLGYAEPTEESTVEYDEDVLAELDHSDDFA